MGNLVTNIKETIMEFFE